MRYGGMDGVRYTANFRPVQRISMVSHVMRKT